MCAPPVCGIGTGALILLALSVVCEATTWHVTFDPEQTEDRIGAVAAQAASGDTVLIDPGTYYEHIPLEDKSLTLIGIAGAASTILDGSREIGGREGSIIYAHGGRAADLIIEGVTLRNGTGAITDWGSVAGGAIYWESAFGRSAGLALSDCVLEDNSTEPPCLACAVGGGAIYALQVSDLRIEDCSFLDNVSVGHGNDLHMIQCKTVIANSVFRSNYSGMRIIHLAAGYSATLLSIRGCLFEADVRNDESIGALVGIWSSTSRTEIVGNQFVDHGGPQATTVFLASGPVEGYTQEVLVSGNVFWNAAGPDSAGPAALSIDIESGQVEVNQNTFDRCGVDIGNGSSISFERNIIARGPAEFWVNGGTLQCNDFWRAPVTDHHGYLVLSDNISNPPLFCNEPAGDLTIASNSPCAAEHSPGGCGHIGALDPACTVSAVKTATWGHIKSLFR